MSPERDEKGRIIADVHDLNTNVHEDVVVRMVPVVVEVQENVRRGFERFETSEQAAERAVAMNANPRRPGYRYEVEVVDESQVIRS